MYIYVCIHIYILLVWKERRASRMETLEDSSPAIYAYLYIYIYVCIHIGVSFLYI